MSPRCSPAKASSTGSRSGNRGSRRPPRSSSRGPSAWPKAPGTAPVPQDAQLNHNAAYDKRGEPLPTTATDHDRTRAIVCRHLATGWALGHFLEPRAVDGQSKHAYGAVGPGTIVDLAADEQTVVFVESQDSTLVKSSRLGQALRREFEEMQPGQTRRFVVSTATHAMACELRRKPAEPGGQGGDTFVLNFYDPNLTTTHLRWKPSGLDELEKIGFEDLVIHRPAAEAYLDGVPLLTLSRVTPATAAAAQQARATGATNALAARRPAQPRLDQEARFAVQDAMRVPAAREKTLRRLVLANGGQDLINQAALLRDMPAEQRMAALHPTLPGMAVLTDNRDALHGLKMLLSDVGLAPAQRRRCLLPPETFVDVMHKAQPGTIDSYLDLVEHTLSGPSLFHALNFDRDRLKPPRPGMRVALERCLARLESPAMRLEPQQRGQLIQKYRRLLQEVSQPGEAPPPFQE